MACLAPLAQWWIKERGIIYTYVLSLRSIFLVPNLARHHKGANPGGGGVLPYKGLMGTCGQPGYDFWDFCLKQGIKFTIFCLNQGIDLSIFVLNRMSFLGR